MLHYVKCVADLGNGTSQLLQYLCLLVTRGGTYLLLGYAADGWRERLPKLVSDYVRHDTPCQRRSRQVGYRNLALLTHYQASTRKCSELKR